MMPSMPDRRRVKVPRWIGFFLPIVDGLENNPLYIRYSGQGFVRGPRWLRRWPMEFSFPAGQFMGRFGCLPFVAIGGSIAVFFGMNFMMTLVISFVMGSPLVAMGRASSALSGPLLALYMAYLNKLMLGTMIVSMASASAMLLWGLWLAVVRFVGADASVRLRGFIINGGREGWGENLFLSLLQPAEYDRALLAAMLGRQGAFYSGVLVGVGVAAASLSVLIGGASLADLIGGAPRFISFAALALVELAALSALQLALELRGIVRHHPALRRRGVNVADNGVLLFLAISGAHVPGGLLCWLWSYTMWDEMGWWPMVAIAAALVIAPAAALMALISRSLFARHEGAAWSAMAAQIYWR